MFKVLKENEKGKRMQGRKSFGSFHFLLIKVLKTSLFLFAALLLFLVGKAFRSEMQGSNALLSAKYIEVVGRVKTPAKDLFQKLNIKEGTPILQIDLQKARAEIESLAWVKNAYILRRLPHKIVVVLEEREAVAFIKDHQANYPVDENGIIIYAAIDAIQDKIFLKGKDAPLSFPSLYEILKTQPELKALVKKAILVSSRRWDIVLEKSERSFVVKLPEEDTKKAWKKLASLEKEKQIFERKVDLIDLRLPDQLIVKLTDGTQTLW